ncbi:MAG: hypothetical protein IJ313_13245 [Clostridia bacterium]|nr:hypothetical protein [Clostridia bacterium]
MKHIDRILSSSSAAWQAFPLAAILCISRQKARDKVACASPFLENGIEKTGNILYNDKRRDCLK